MKTYLRRWAAELNASILSVDYALAPEHPFPCAVNQVRFALQWARHNLRQLGCCSAGDGSGGKTRIFVAADSAGANLVSAALLSIIDEWRAAESLFVQLIV